MKTLLFDLDGTLTDPKAGILGCIRYTLGSLGWSVLPEEEEIFWCIGPPLRHSFGKLLNTDSDEEIERAVSIYRKQYDRLGKFENVVFEGVPETLRSFQQEEFRLFVATSKPQVFADQIIDHFSLRPFFVRVYGIDFEGILDEKSKLIAHLLKEENLQSSDCIMVGDRKHDVIAAKNNGLDSCGVTWGYGSVEELKSAGATWICDEPSQLRSCMSL
jgi:phosphoglycolate phosphatase